MRGRISQSSHLGLSVFGFLYNAWEQIFVLILLQEENSLKRVERFSDIWRQQYVIKSYVIAGFPLEQRSILSRFLDTFQCQLCVPPHGVGFKSNLKNDKIIGFSLYILPQYLLAEHSCGSHGLQLCNRMIFVFFTIIQSVLQTLKNNQQM